MTFPPPAPSALAPPTLPQRGAWGGWKSWRGASLLLLAGVALTVLCAWLGAILAPRSRVEVIRSGGPGADARYLIFSQHRGPLGTLWVVRHGTPGGPVYLTLPSYVNLPTETDRRDARTHAFGFPFASLRWYQRERLSPSSTSPRPGVVQIGGLILDAGSATEEPMVLPLALCPLGFAGSAAVWMVLIVTVTGGREEIASRYAAAKARRELLCPHCGYSRVGITAKMPCPECGKMSTASR